MTDQLATLSAKKPETIEDCRETIARHVPLLIECRDALPAISMASAKLHNVDLSLADRIERALEPWRVE